MPGPSIIAPAVLPTHSFPDPGTPPRPDSPPGIHQPLLVLDAGIVITPVEDPSLPLASPTLPSILPTDDPTPSVTSSAPTVRQNPERYPKRFNRMRTYIYHQSTSPEQPDLTTHSPEIPQPLSSHSRDLYSDKRNRPYHGVSDINPTRQDYYTLWNATSSRPPRHFTSRSRDRDLPDTQRRYRAAEN